MVSGNRMTRGVELIGLFILITVGVASTVSVELGRHEAGR